MEKLVITAAITGAEATKEHHPGLPVTPKEQGIEVRNCIDAGASIVHLHVRDRNERPSVALEDFRATIEEVRRYCRNEVILQLSMQGAACGSVEEKIAPFVHFRPEMTALCVSSRNFGKEVFINQPSEIEHLARHMLELNVKPVIQCYDASDIEIAQRMIKRGIIKEPACYQFILGVPGGMSGEAYHINHLVSMLRPGDVWSVAGVGRYHVTSAAIAIAMGGHVRVGFEDCVYYHKDQPATSNAQLVGRIKRIAQELGREVATAEEARKIFSLCQG